MFSVETHSFPADEQSDGRDLAHQVGRAIGGHDEHSAIPAY
jgi:hypothetical protein